MAQDLPRRFNILNTSTDMFQAFKNDGATIPWVYDDKSNRQSVPQMQDAACGFTMAQDLPTRFNILNTSTNVFEAFRSDGSVMPWVNNEKSNHSVYQEQDPAHMVRMPHGMRRRRSRDTSTEMFDSFESNGVITPFVDDDKSKHSDLHVPHLDARFPLQQGPRYVLNVPKSIVSNLTGLPENLVTPQMQGFLSNMKVTAKKAQLLMIRKCWERNASMLEMLCHEKLTEFETWKCLIPSGAEGNFPSWSAMKRIVEDWKMLKQNINFLRVMTEVEHKNLLSQIDRGEKLETCYSFPHALPGILPEFFPLAALHSEILNYERSSIKHQNKGKSQKKGKKQLASTPAKQASKDEARALSPVQKEEQWTVVTKKKTRSGYQPVKQKLMRKVAEAFPSYDVHELDEAVLIARTENKGSLKGLTVNEILTRVNQILWRLHIEKSREVDDDKPSSDPLASIARDLPELTLSNRWELFKRK